MIVTGLVVVAVVIADQHKSLPRAASSGVVAAGTSSVLAGTSIDSDRMSGSGVMIVVVVSLQQGEP